MRVLIAADKFKDALSAPQACAAIAAGLRLVRPDWTLDLCPLADGGDGFARILTEAAGGEWQCRKVRGPRGAPVAAGFGLVRMQALPPPVRARLEAGGLPEVGEAHGRLAVLEMAAASGLALVPPAERDVWQADTRGTGDLIAAAAGLGVEGILLGVGGSATHDLGLGALASLGLELLTARGGPAPICAPAGWPDVARVELRGLRKPPPLWIACDVDNPLLGPRGAAAVYAPQKGLRTEDLPRLERETARLAALLSAARENGSRGLEQTPGAGAAGGIAFGLMTAVGARLVPGSDLVFDWLSLEARLACADLVITGEGAFDESSVQGKGPGSLVRAVCGRGGVVHVFAGRVAAGLPLPGLRLHEISPRGAVLADALARTETRLRDCVAETFAGDGWANASKRP